MATGTQKKIGELYKETVITLETRREEALKSISDLRTEITGEGLQWEAPPWRNHKIVILSLTERSCPAGLNMTRGQLCFVK